MSNVIERLREFAAKLEGGALALPEIVPVPASQCLPPDSAGVDIDKDQSYITITVNELYLAQARKWWSIYDPMVLFTTSFIYDDKRITVPRVVGPSLLAQAGQIPPQRLVLHDTTAAGPYPYRGGGLTISAVLYRVKREDHARNLLRIVEGLSSAIGPAADFGLLTRVGGTLIDGLETLLHLGDTESVAGHRIEMSSVRPGGLRTSFTALICAAQVEVSELRVIDGRLRTVGGGETSPYGAADYVLYKVDASSQRDDERTLPFYPLYQRALRNAAQAGDDAWTSAKASFSDLWQQMSLSPDLTKDQAKALFAAWRQDLLDARERGKDVQLLSVTPGTEKPSDRLREAASILSW